MAGRPKTRAMLQHIEKMGGEAAVLELIEGGRTVLSIAKECGVSDITLRRWLSRTPESANVVSRAREAAAHALADESLELARQTDEDNHRSNKVKLSQLNHLAGKWNRAVYGDTPLVAVQFNVGELALEALKQTPPPVPQHLVVEAQKDSDNQAE